MQGLTLVTLKKHPALIPLYVCIVAGAVMAGGYTLRLATRGPDVQWNKKLDPNEEYRTKQSKFYTQRIDWNTYECPAPDYAKKD